MTAPKHSPRDIIAALKEVAGLPGADPHKPAILDAIRLIAESTAAVSKIRGEKIRIRREREEIGVGT